MRWVSLFVPVHLVSPFIATTYTFVSSRPLVMSSFFCLSRAHTCTCVLTLAFSAPPRVCVTGIHLDCVFVFRSLPLFSRGVEQACRAPLNKALCSVLRISLETSSDVPARSAFNYNKILAFATVLRPQTLHVPSSLSIDRFAVLQFEPCFFRFFTCAGVWQTAFTSARISISVSTPVCKDFDHAKVS